MYTEDYIDIDGRCKKINKNKVKKLIDEETGEGKRAIALAISKSIYPTDNLRRNTLVGIIFIKDGKIFNELIKGNDTRKQFFEKIIEIQTLLGGELGDVI